MPLVFRHFRNVALFGFIQLAAWSCVCATECALNASCPVMNNCPSSPECCLFMLEELSIGVEIGNVNIRTDINDILTNNTGEISLNGGGNEVELNETTGTLRIVNRVDREARHMRCLEVAIDLIPDNGLATVRLIGIIVEDINDNSPVFPSSDSPYSVQTKEGTNVSIGIKGVTELSATDPDESYGDVTYSLAGEESDKFEIVMDGDKPCIKNVVELDRDDIPNPSNTPTNLLTLVLVATDNGGEQGNTTFIVNITDVNDNPPVFTEASLETVTIPEDIGDGAIIRDLNATDRDYNNTLTYSLLSNIFHVNGETGEISVLPNENDLSTDGYNLQVAVNDGEHPDVVQTLMVEVQDVNEEAEIINLGIFIGEDTEELGGIQEEMNPLNLTILFRVDDEDVGNTYHPKVLGAHTENFSAIYELVQVGSFGIIKVSLSDPIDQEALIRETGDNIITLCIELTETSDSKNFTQHHPFNITVAGINDNAPFLNKTVFEAEEEKIGRIEELQGLDLDSGEDGEVKTYCVVSAFASPSSPSNLTAEFKYRNPCLQTTLFSPKLDREAGIETVTVTMNLTDGGNMSLSSLVNITISIIDINDNYPSFSGVDEGYKIQMQVVENTEPNIVGSVTANDGDIGTNAEIVYELLTETDNFSIDRELGKVRALKEFDRESQHKYTIRVKAINVAKMADDADTSNLRDEVQVVITITDVNDNAPEWETQADTFTANSDATIGELVIHLIATDPDSKPDITYNLEPSILFNVSANGRIEVAANLVDKIDRYNLLLTASDGKFTTPRNITIIVEEPVPSTSSSLAIIASVASVCVLVAIVIVVMGLVLYCLYVYNKRHSVKLSKRNSRLETDGVSSPTRGILRPIPNAGSTGTSRNSSATRNGRGVKFEPTVQKIGYVDEHAVNNNSDLYVTSSTIRLDSSGSGDESPVTPPRLTTTSHYQNGKLPLEGHSHIPNGASRLPPIQENFEYLYTTHHPMRSHPMQDDPYSDEDSDGPSDDDSTLASSRNAPLPSVRHLSRMAPSPHSTSPSSHLGPLLPPMPQISPSHQFPRSSDHSGGLNSPRHDNLSIRSTSSDSLTDTIPPVHTHLAHENQRLGRPQGRSAYPVHMPEGYLMPPSSSSRYLRDSFMDRFRGTDFEDTSTYASAELDEALHFRPDQEPGIFTLTATSSYDEESQL